VTQRWHPVNAVTMKRRFYWKQKRRNDRLASAERKGRPRRLPRQHHHPWSPKKEEIIQKKRHRQPPANETPADASAKKDDTTATPALVAEPPKNENENQQEAVVSAKVHIPLPKKPTTTAPIPEVEAWQSSDPKKTRGNRRQDPQQTPPARVGMNNRALCDSSN
jgi:hypothetical protein